MPPTPSSTPRGTPSRRGRSPRAISNSSPPIPSNHPESSKSASITSSLSIAVQGATPIDHSSEIATRIDKAYDSRRAPRKSKTDALAALHNGRSETPMGSEDLDRQGMDRPSQPVAWHGPPIAVSPELDLSTVKTSSPRHANEPSNPRPFNLENCPTFYPTPEEFKDAMGYIRSIADRARDYGMCKIVPPMGWKMPFVTDTEAFRFKTRLQRLNSIEASSRAKLNFLEALYRFHKQQGNPRVTVPTINHKPLDLWLLRKEVQKLGGFEAVNKGKKWADLGRLLGYGGIPGLSTQLKNSYVRVILPFEHLSERYRSSPPSSSASGVNGKENLFVNTETPISNRGEGSNSPSGPASPLSITSSPLSEPPDDSEIFGPGLQNESMRIRRSVRNGNLTRAPSTNDIGSPMNGQSVFARSADKANTKQEQICEICLKTNRETEMLLCDGCDCGFHTFCLSPPLGTIPKGQWFCNTCLFGIGGDFGFDEGEEHSLSSFQARDLAFRKLWFESHPPPSASATPAEGDVSVNKIGSVYVSEYDVEDEFWRLVQSHEETVDIEYGADIHSTTHGSAMPSLESHPLDPYSKDGWNLNNIPILSDSLLRFIKSDISGMTVPWTYVGMIFSTFCWHNEDHYTYSINYMHWGETKTWYGIPGDDAEKFEAAIRREAPDLFESQPDLLFQLVTLMNPRNLTDAGVRVYACNQRAGEFVITFPKAYHAGFNHGFNFNEAVNFALPDWLIYGRDCVRRYREHRKPPVFSHDELLITITQQSHSIRTAIWLNDSLSSMIDRELRDRNDLRNLSIKQVLEEKDHPEEQYQCYICKVFCYLSQVICDCPKVLGVRAACLDHAGLLCDCSMSQRTLRLRFSDDELRNIQSTVAARAAIPSNWRSKLKRVLAESSRPPLRSLRALLAEGERINHPLEELPALQRCVARGNEWVDAANSFTTRKQSRKRMRRSRDGQILPTDSSTLLDGFIDKPDRTLTDLYTLLDEVDLLGFDTPEISQLKNVATQAEEFKTKAQNILTSWHHRDVDTSALLQDCKTLLAHGSSLNIFLEEYYKIEDIVLQEQLTKDLKEMDDSTTTLDELRQLLNRAHACNLPANHKYMLLLESRLKAGSDWDDRALKVLAQPIKTIEELDQFVDFESSIPIDPAVLSRLTAAQAKAIEYERQAKAWMSPEPNSILPKVSDTLRLVQRAEKEFSIPAIHDLKRTAEFAFALEERCEAVLKHQYQHREEGSPFDAMRRWMTYAREHLSKFSLPNFTALSQQLELHTQWLRKLPWAYDDQEEPNGTDILEDVVENTKPEDDAPPQDEFFTCICFEPVRPPPPKQVSDAVQCDHCYARFHGICAANGGSCPFCDPNHWNGNIHKERSWHFCYLPTVLYSAPEITKNYSEAWNQLNVIVRRVERLSTVVSQFLAFASQPGNQHPDYIPQVRHFMRKLYKLQFAVSPNPEVSFGLDLAGLHRILAGRPLPVRMKKRRRPRFVFGQDVDKDWVDGTRCICRGRTPYLRGYPVVECDLCSQLYHIACVFYTGPGPSAPNTRPRFTCPLCCLRKARPYPYAEVRVKYLEGGGYEDANIFVDVKTCVENFSKDIIRVKLSPPVTQTLFVDLVHFIPGQPDYVAVNQPAMPISSRPPPPPQPHSTSSRSLSSQAQISPRHSAALPRPQLPAAGTSLPPPPPWAVPPAQFSQHSSSRPPMKENVKSGERKRKYSDAERSHTPENAGVSDSIHSPKRRMSSTQVPLVPTSPHRTVEPVKSVSGMTSRVLPVALPTQHGSPYQPSGHHSPAAPGPPIQVHRTYSQQSSHFSASSSSSDVARKHFESSAASEPLDTSSSVNSALTSVRKVKLLFREDPAKDDGQSILPPIRSSVL